MDNAKELSEVKPGVPVNQYSHQVNRRDSRLSLFFIPVMSVGRNGKTHGSDMAPEPKQNLEES